MAEMKTNEVANKSFKVKFSFSRTIINLRFRETIDF